MQQQALEGDRAEPGALRTWIAISALSRQKKEGTQLRRRRGGISRGACMGAGEGRSQRVSRLALRRQAGAAAQAGALMPLDVQRAMAQMRAWRDVQAGGRRG